MFWPRLKLTPEEEAVCSKYADGSTKPAVLRRAYPGFLELTSTQRLPIFPFYTSRRVRIFGLTVTGDVPYFRLQIRSATGEEYLAQQTYLPHLFTGANQSILGIPPTAVGGATHGAFPGFSPCPFIMDPNIVLSPNQTLQFEGTEVTAATDEDPGFRIDFVLHVWEFPGMDGGPR